MPALEKCDALSKRREAVTIVQANMTGDVIISVFARISLDLKRPALHDGVLRSGSSRARFDEHKILDAPSDGRDRLAWPGITHARVRPTWVRVSDFTVDPPRILELIVDTLLA